MCRHSNETQIPPQKLAHPLKGSRAFGSELAVDKGVEQCLYDSVSH